VKIKQVHALQWIAEPLETHPTFFQKKMFGCEMLCLHDKQMLVLAAKDEPWNGLLVCTSREHHESLMADVPALRPHSVLGKWLYISQTHPDFEAAVDKITSLALRADERLGVVSKPRPLRELRSPPRKRRVQASRK
jgi:hypothetical protein